MEVIKNSILIVEDDEDVAEMLDAYFRVQGYEVKTVHWGEDALQSCRQKRPDIIILDIRLPDIDGFEVARTLRSARLTHNIPIIFLTEKRGRPDVLEGLGLGADDYITKPFDIQELRLRVRNSLKYKQRGSLKNMVTGLPEGEIVDKKLTECIKEDDWSLILICLNNMETFRDIYGFVAADDVLRAISLIIQNSISEVGHPTDFIGHIGPYEFVIATRQPSIKMLCEKVRSSLEPTLEFFYPLEDRVDEFLPEEDQLALQLNVVDFTEEAFENLDQLKKALDAIFR